MRMYKIYFVALIVSLIASTADARSITDTEMQDYQNKDRGKSYSATLLLPLTPKIDTQKLVDSEEENNVQEKTSAKGESLEREKFTGFHSPLLNSKFDGSSTRIDIEIEEDQLDDIVSEDTKLKGTIQIVADDTEYDSENNTFLGTGNAVCIIGGQNSKLEADEILYDQDTEMVNAHGHVTVFRNGQITTGQSFRFNVASDEYLITQPNSTINGATIISRSSFGSNKGLAYKNGTLELPKALVFQKNQFFGPIGFINQLASIKQHPNEYVPAKPSFKYTAKKIVYEKYKDTNNLTLFGGKILFGKFGIPFPKLVTTVTKTGNEIVLPIEPAIGNNLQVGGVHIGPRFNTILPNGNGVLSWSPAIQLGGRTLDGLSSSSGIGLSGNVSLKTKKLEANLATGSVNSILVGDLHYRVSPNLRFQAGLNRFLDDGIFGFRRARLAAELIDSRVFNNIPFISSLGLRSSAGWFQDNPQLVNLNPGFADLFGGTQTSRVLNSGFRIQEQLTATTHPLFVVGNDKYGVRSYLYAGLALRGYSTGDLSLLSQIGPVLDVRLNRFNFLANYNQSFVRGSSPFVFDQFIQGQRSVNLSGDYKVNKYLSIGGGLGYNLTNRLFFSRTVSAAIGPEDFKVLLTRDLVRGINRVGFNIIYGAPIAFNRLALKGKPDHGQLSGI